MVFSAEEAARRAEKATTNDPGMCQSWTRQLFDAPAVGDWDGDRSADAEDGWKSEPEATRHSDRNPPRGAPVAYLGGSRDNGHRAVSLGNRKIRTTDGAGLGRVATVDLDWPEKQWGLTYVGWSETISGLLIPGLGIEKEKPMPRRLAVYKMLERAGVETYLRTEWGTRYEKAYLDRRGTHKMAETPARYHFLHITVTEDTDTVKEGFEGARQVEGYGYSTPPQVSYQDLVTNEARVYQGQSYGTPGTHTLNDFNVPGFPENLNYYGYAAAIMQNEGDEVTDEQVRVLAMIYAARELTGWVKKGAPIYPHRKFSSKRCPGDKAVARLPEIERLKNKFVKEGLPDFVEETEPLTRGEEVDRAIKRLEAAKGGGERRERIDRALKILKRIDYLNAKD